MCMGLLLIFSLFSSIGRTMIFEFNMMDMKYDTVYDMIYDMVCDMVYDMMYDMF